MSKLIEQEDYCLNCKTTLQGDFCHHCGQQKIDTNNDSFLHTMTHFLGDFVHFDSQVFATAIPLLFKPGFLVNEYLKGKRARYLSPIRMYVFLSFLFFFLTGSLSDFQKKSTNDISIISFDVKNDSTGKNQRLSWNQFSDTLRKDKTLGDSIVSFKGSKYTSVEQYDSAQHAAPKNERDNWLLFKLKEKGLMVKEKILSKDRGEFMNELAHNFMHNIPKILFFLLPFFALLLKILYRKRYYAEHLIFSITFYNFFFLFGSLMLLIQFIPILNNFSTIFFFLIPLAYLLLSMVNVYKQGKIQTGVKFLVFIVVFYLFLAFGLVLNGLLTVLSI